MHMSVYIIICMYMCSYWFSTLNNVCLYMCIFTLKDTHNAKYVYICIYVFKYMSVCLGVGMYAKASCKTHTCSVHACVYMYICMYVCICIYTCVENGP